MLKGDGRMNCPDACSDGPELSRREALHVAGGSILGLSALVGATEPAQAAGGAVPTPTTRLDITINGRRHSLDIDPRVSLLDLLREELDLPGTKKGCNQGACGACTVLLDGKRVNACLTLAVMHEGAQVTTIEGLAMGGDLHPLQAAFIRHDGLQCGYCTPGQIMSGIGCINEGHANSPEEVKAWMSGNICRCGAYPGIVEAVLEVAGGTRS